jgi:hypothetical protein
MIVLSVMLLTMKENETTHSTFFYQYLQYLLWSTVQKQEFFVDILDHATKGGWAIHKMTPLPFLPSVQYLLPTIATIVNGTNYVYHHSLCSTNFFCNSDGQINYEV